MEDQAVEVVGQIRQCHFLLRSRQSDGPDEQTKALLLVGKDVLNPSADGRLLRIRPTRRLSHGLAARFLAVDLATQHTVRQHGLIGLRTIGTVCPNITAGVVGCDQPSQHAAIGMSR